MRSRWVLFVAIACVALILDQWTKLLAVKHLTPTIASERIARETGARPIFAPSREVQEAALAAVGPLEDWALFYGAPPSPCADRGAVCPPVQVFEGFWRWHYAENPGAAFSIFSTLDERMRVPFLVGIALLGLLGVFLYVRALGAHQRTEVVAFAMIAGGAFGNIVDRARLGYVIDFIDWYAGTKRWPTFNVADAAICAGMALFALASFDFHRRREATVGSAAPNDSLAGPMP